MSRHHPMPDPAEAAEICRVARTGGARAGASGAVLDDVVQTVAINIATRWDEPYMVAARSRTSTAWHAYIMVCARNAYRDIGRGEGRRWVREQRSVSPAAGDPLPDRPGVQRRGPDEPASNLERYVARRLIADLLGEHLEGRSRQVAALVFIDGLTSQEIAERLELSVRSVNRIKRAAIARLQAAIRTDEGLNPG